MHPDPQPTPKPVVHVMRRPQFVSQSDGTVRGYYPGEDWHVTGTDREDAIKRLSYGRDKTLLVQQDLP